MLKFQKSLTIISIVAVGAVVLTSDKAAAASVTADQRKVFEGVIRDYLLKEPIIIRQAIDKLREQEEAAKKMKAAAALKNNKDELFYDKSSPVGGNPKGDVTIVQFFDYNCGYCKRAAHNLRAVMRKDPNLRVVFKEFAILGPQSIKASRAALAARNQGKYIEFYEGLMAGKADEDSVAALSHKLKMDYSQLLKDMADPRIETALRKNYELANALGIKGTPVFVIGERVIPGAVGEEILTQLIKEERSKKKR